MSWYHPSVFLLWGNLIANLISDICSFLGSYAPWLTWGSVERLPWKLAASQKNAMNDRGNVVWLTRGAGKPSPSVSFCKSCWLTVFRQFCLNMNYHVFAMDGSLAGDIMSGPSADKVLAVSSNSIGQIIVWLGHSVFWTWCCRNRNLYPEKLCVSIMMLFF